MSKDEPSLVQENTEIINLLESIEKFQPIPREDLNTLVEMGRIREYKPGEVIIHQGDYDCWVFILLQGSVKIFKDDRHIGDLRRNGDVFGEMGIIDGSPRSATITAGDNCIILGIDGSVIDRCLNDDNLLFCYTIYRIFSEVLAARLRDTTQENARLSSENKWLRRNL